MLDNDCGDGEVLASPQSSTQSISSDYSDYSDCSDHNNNEVAKEENEESLYNSSLSSLINDFMKIKSLINARKYKVREMGPLIRPLTLVCL